MYHLNENFGIRAEVEEDEGPSFEAVHITMEVIHLPCID